ncbi:MULTISPECIES: distal tail protein Dit [Lactococcus]|uniref:distal tail protein Dit n=1 Tax=Lactococcus TaxID=1357 RepID=UPI0014321CB9|nr:MULTISPECIES: distal tail protein Dit [Lactococcus]KAF6606077.1 phage tail family protein [Lactococcus sp. EKM201L]KAF6610898.1 phage tail family protein [Lactococcus sp. EKM203L]KAF6639951.1 phage tail family protein [Lactococcus sp. EKM501L]KAF6641456.1 phage tail family protein [Lactococcus sp. EKM502L]KAF6650580.1 phage tail family protein [Lactococcus sp. EKM101L]
MYKFRDTTKREHYRNLPFIPTSAMSYDGTWLEELIEGYQTLAVEGREMYSLSFESQELQVGGVIINVKYPPRELTIKYKLEDRDSRVLQEKFDTLKAYLIRQEDVPIIFHDDLEYTFYGRFQTADNVPGDTNSIISSFTVFCSDPFKHGKTQSVKNKVIEVLPYPVKPDKLSFELLTDGLIATDGSYRLKSSQAKNGDLLEFDFQTGDTLLNGKVNNNLLDLDSDFKNIRLTTGTDFSSSNYELTIQYRKAVL